MYFQCLLHALEADEAHLSIHLLVVLFITLADYMWVAPFLFFQTDTLYIPRLWVTSDNEQDGVQREGSVEDHQYTEPCENWRPSKQHQGKYLLSVFTQLISLRLYSIESVPKKIDKDFYVNDIFQLHDLVQ